MTMPILKIELDLYPPSANCIWRNIKGKTLLSSCARAFYSEGLQLLSLTAAVRRHVRRGGYVGAVSVKIALFPATRRKHDIDNRIKPMLDLLTKAGVWRDDDQVKELYVRKYDYAEDKKGKVFLEIRDIETC